MIYANRHSIESMECLFGALYISGSMVIHDNIQDMHIIYKKQNINVTAI